MTQQISSQNPPPAEALTEWRKTATTFLQWVDEPFQVTTMEGTTYVIDETAEHWEGGYWVSWPTDGTDPYPVAPSFVRENYEQVQPAPSRCNDVLGRDHPESERCVLSTDHEAPHRGASGATWGPR